MQQRGEARPILALLLQYGRRVRAGKGAETVYFDKGARRRLQTVLGHDATWRNSKQLNAYVVCHGTRLLAVGKPNKRVRR